MNPFFESTALLLVLLNPFLVMLYILDLVEKLPAARFRSVMIRGSLIATSIFLLLSLLGDAVFTTVIQAEFASFQIFGGIIFLLVGLQFIFKGPKAIESLRGDSDNVAGTVAMPGLIGPGTISASILAGQKLSPVPAGVAIVLAVSLSIGMILLLKQVHDHVRPRREPLVQRYIEITGRITALFLGTISIEMIMRGVITWAGKAMETF